MRRFRGKVAMLTLVLALGGVPCLGATLFPAPPDMNCNPSTDPPSSGGCVWYNFYETLPNGTPTAGSSFAGYYVNAGDPMWTFTSTGFVLLRVLDGGHQGDTFDAFDNGILLGTTSSTTIDATHACASDPTGPGTDPAACWNDPLMSRGIFLLGPGSHSINILWDQKVPGGNSTLQWFEIASVPEPNTLVLLGSALVAVALLRTKRRLR